MPSTATSSHTSALCAGPSFVVGAGLPTMRVQYASLSPDSVERLVAGQHRQRRQCQLLGKHVGQLQFVGEVILAVGGRYRDGFCDHAGEQR